MSAVASIFGVLGWGALWSMSIVFANRSSPFDVVLAAIAFAGGSLVLFWAIAHLAVVA